MRILLVNPPNCGRSIPEEQYGIDSLKLILRGEPLSLEVLAANLDGHDVSMIDLKVEPDAYGACLEEYRPQVVGITGVTCEAPTMLRLASAAKAATGATVVVGGVHASNDPLFFNRPEIDYVVVGLGKLSFRELIEALATGDGADRIEGVMRTNPGGSPAFAPRAYSRADLVQEKAPRYDLVEKYRSHYILPSLGFRIGLVSTASGCPHRCTFCSIERMTGGRYITNDPETVVRDIGMLGDIPIIRLVDANTFGNIAQARALSERIRAAGIRKAYVADVRSDTVVRHPDLFSEWKEVGLRSVIVGFEEIDDGRLGAMEKAPTIPSEARAPSRQP